MNEELIKKLDAQDKKLEEIWQSVEKTRKYFLTSVIITVLMTVLPLIGLAIAIPLVLTIFSEAYSGLL